MATQSQLKSLGQRIFTLKQNNNLLNTQIANLAQEIGKRDQQIKDLKKSKAGKKSKGGRGGKGGRGNRKRNRKRNGGQHNTMDNLIRILGYKQKFPHKSQSQCTLEGMHNIYVTFIKMKYNIC